MKDIYKNQTILRRLSLFVTLISMTIFSYGQGITFTSPNSSTVWEIGDNEDVVYNVSSPAISHVEIGLIQDGTYIASLGDDYCEIGVNTISFTISSPSINPGLNYQIVIYNLADMQPVNTSDNFEIIAASPKITELSEPTTGYYWQNGTSGYIYWKSWAVDEVDIDYSINGGANWINITTNETVLYEGTNYYQWNIAGITGDNPNSIVRVSSSADNSIYKESSIFMLSEFPPYRITSPSASTNWELGSQQTITINNVCTSSLWSPYLKLYIDNLFQEYIYIGQDLDFGLTDVVWDIPISYSASNNCKLYLFDAMDDFHGESDIFELSEPSPAIMSISSPVSGNYWANNFNYDIVFNTYGLSEVDIEYTTNGTDYTPIASNIAVTNGENTYTWSVTGIIGTNSNSQIRISESGNASNNLSSELFTLAEHTPLYFVNPNATSVWQLGSTQTIEIMVTQFTWDNYDIALYINDVFVENIPNYISFYTGGLKQATWDISSGLTASTNCVLKLVTDDWESTVIAVSDVFEISTPPASVLSISAPTTGAFWNNNQDFDIIFDTYGLSEVDIEYTTNGTVYTPIASNVAVANGENTYTWLVTGISGTNSNSRIRISESGNASNNLSSELFTLAEHTPIYFIDPNSTSNWQLGSTQTIKLKVNAVQPIGYGYTFELFIDGTSVGILENSSFMIDDFVGIFEQEWIIQPSYTPSTNCVLKLVRYDWEYVVLYESETFELSAPPASVLSISAPGTSSYWSNNNSYDIIFDTYGLTEVDIEYTTNGTDYTPIASNVAVTNGENTYNWTVTAIVGTFDEAQIRISESGNATNNLNSADFTLSDTPIIEFIYPTASSIWFTDDILQTCQVINHSQNHISTGIRLYIDNISFTDEYSSLNSGENDFTFNISGAWASTNCNVQIYDVTGLIAQSETFEIKNAAPTVYNITNPHSGSIWANTQTKNINFSTHMVNTVDIEYSTNNGSSWSSIVSGHFVEDGENFYSWDINGIVGTNSNSLIRITDATSTATSTSENFTLMETALCEFTNPTASSTWTPGSQETISITNNDVSDITNVDIELYKGDVYVETLQTGVTLNIGNNDFIWDVPSSYSNATNYSLKLIQNTNIELCESEYFTISYINNVSVAGKVLFQHSNLSYFSNIPILHKLPEMIYVTVENLGNQAQSNFTINIDLYEDETIVDSYTENFSGTLATGTSTTLNYQFNNILSFNNYSAGSTYKYEFNVELSGTDENISDNTDIRSFNLTDNLFTAHQIPTDHQATIAEYVSYGHPAIVNEFYFRSTDKLDSIQVHITDVNGSAQIRPVVYDYNNIIYTGPIVTISASNIGQTITMPCAFTFPSEDIYYIGVKHVSGQVEIPASQPVTSQFGDLQNSSWLTFNNVDWWLYENGTLAMDIYVGGNGIISNIGTELCTNNDVNLTIVPFNEAASYQWYYEGTEIIDETGEVLTIENITLEQAGEYSFTINGNNGASIDLSVSETPSIVMLDEVDAIEGLDITISPVVTGGSSNYQYSWSNSTNNNTLSITTSNNADYYLTVTDNVSSCQAIDSIGINVQKARICMVTVDTSMVDGKNIIVWEKPETEVIASYNIYKEVSTNVYDIIGSLAYDSDSEYTDWLSAPSVHADKYKISAIDTAGNESALSPYHQTMNLSKVPAGNGVVLFWNKYIDESGEFSPTNYHVYRGLDPDNLDLETSLSGGLSSYNYNIANALENEYYLVSIQLAGTCNPLSAKSGEVYTHSVSNFDRFDATELETEISQDISIYPNPTNGLVNIEFTDKNFVVQTIYIYTIDGKIVNQVNIDNNTIINLDMSKYAKGVYFFNFETSNGTLVKKLIIE